MRALAALAVVGLATPAAAQDRPQWVGLWEGRIGGYPVRVCLDRWDDLPGRGSYYYLSQLEPISLSQEEGELTWIERAPGSESEAFWQPDEMTATRLRGVWLQRDRSLPIDLEAVPWTEGEWGEPCASAEFIAPRLAGGEVEADEMVVDGFGYTRLRYRPPAHLAEDVTIEAFAYEGEEAGDTAINAALAEYVPDGAMQHGFVECLAGALSAHGTDGFFEQTVTPTLLSNAFLAFAATSATYCGGARPDYYTLDRTFDRHTGAEIDLSDWLGPGSFDGEGAIAETLRTLVVARWPEDSDPECRELAGEADYWSLGLVREGLVFRPDLPHVATACEEPVTVEWEALAPYLGDHGRTGVTRLRGG